MLEFCEACQSTEVSPTGEGLLCALCGHVTRRKKTNKWKNIPTFVDGIRFPSELEARRYSELVLMEKEGLIRYLERQVRFTLVPNYVDNEGCKARGVSYVADFRYLEVATGLTIVEDAKGRATDTFLVKWRMLRYLFRNEKKTLFRIVS